MCYLHFKGSYITNGWHIGRKHGTTNRFSGGAEQIDIACYRYIYEVRILLFILGMLFSTNNFQEFFDIFPRIFLLINKEMKAIQEIGWDRTCLDWRTKFLTNIYIPAWVRYNPNRTRNI